MFRPKAPAESGGLFYQNPLPVLLYILITIMKSGIIFFSFGLLLLYGCGAGQREIPAQPTPVTMQVFYNELSPYGKWISHPTYGYVWLPMEDPDTFFPYGTNGHWVSTEYGWTWVSDYKWGWAPFHYGRWDYDRVYGWFWVPDIVWGPAWVVWSTSGDYYGWAPMRPGIGITIVIEGSWIPPAPWWIFVHHRHMGHRHIRRYYERRERYGRIIGEQHVIGRTHDDRARGVTYLSGPDNLEVEKASGAPVVQLPIIERTKPGQSLDDKAVSIYRPAIERAPQVSPKPIKIDDPKTVRSAPSSPVTPKPTDDGLEEKPTAPASPQEPEARPMPIPKHDRKGEVTKPNPPPVTQQPKNAAKQPTPKQKPSQKQVPQKVTSAPKQTPAQPTQKKGEPVDQSK
jgi:hypothetical protein